jgi:hypothetical protein
VSTDTTRPALLCPDPAPAECRHSKAAFHALFVPIAKRGDLSDAAKLLHQTLVSMVRQGLRWTQAELAEALGWKKRQKVWRAATELVAAGLLRVKRIGLQRPNEYVLVETDEISQDDIKARALRSAGSQSGHQEDRPRNVSRARVPSYPKNETKNGNTTGLKGYADRRCRRCQGHGRHCDRCSACLPGPHADQACYPGR